MRPAAATSAVCVLTSHAPVAAICNTTKGISDPNLPANSVNNCEKRQNSSSKTRYIGRNARGVAADGSVGD